MRFMLMLFVFGCFPTGLWALHGGAIRGMVTSAAGEPLVGVSVRLEEKKWLAATDDIGVFSFSDLPGGVYTLSVACLGYQGARVTVSVNDHETTNTRMVLEEKRIDLEDVEITAAQLHPLQTISRLDIGLRPLQSSQEILRLVPGLFIAQHAGGGKAEQIFLRGFDIDHGTDIALFADGIPVNMVSHAHGQGYADLHFLIPELVQRVDFQKGMYDARTGNFATAGQVRFESPTALDQNFIKLEAGQFDTYRLVTAVDLFGKNAATRGLNAYLAGEQVFSNAYFDAPQQFRRQNYFGKISHTPDDRQSFSLSMSAFSSSWLASGQIPERAVARGQIGHFGAIDSTEGGSTARYNLNAEHVYALSNNTAITNQLYFSQYDFELYSNFTFFLVDPQRGDQIRQRESRRMTGYNGRITHRTRWADRAVLLEGGLQFRGDQVSGIELSRTFQRRDVLERLARGDLQETNTSAYALGILQLGPHRTLELGGRYDHFRYYYENALDSLFRPASTTRSRWSPKFNLQWQANKHLQLFLRSGMGFHSNDTRVVLFSPGQNILPAARGLDVGLHWQPARRFFLHLAAWRLDLEQELVYVGDAGIVEPGGKTRRYGLDLSGRWQLTPHLFLDGDYTWTRARTIDAPEGERYIPLAPEHTAAAGIQWISPAFTAGIRARYLGDRPANEDYSLTARGYTLFDAQAAFSPAFQGGKRPLEIVFSAQNLANTRWYEAQFETESRLRDETAPVSEIHFTPGTPFFVKGGIIFKF